MPIVPERFVQARLAKGWEQPECAKMLNVKQQTISAIEKGITKHPRNLARWARQFGVSQSWLLGETDDPTPSVQPLREYPIPILPYEEVEPWLRNPIINPKHRVYHMYFSENNVSNLLFFVEIEGDSMVSLQNLEDSYFPSHLALIDPNGKPKPGDGVLIKINQEIKLRLFTKDGTETILQAYNPKYPNIKFTKDVKILGTVKLTMKPRDWEE